MVCKDFDFPIVQLLLDHIVLSGCGGFHRCFLHGRRNAQKHFAGLLHNNGIDLQLCGHTHRYEVIKPEEGVSNIYTVVGGGHTGQPNSNYTRVDLNGNELKVSLKHTSGELTEEFAIRK